MNAETIAGLAPVRKTIQVDLSPVDAFELFTTGMSTWWPLGTHSISRSRAVGCEVERRTGGRVYEVRDDGETFPWGSVLAWDPPHRLVLSWRPGRPEEAAQEVEVRFQAADGGTRVDLEHRGWAALGEDAIKLRGEYDSGWNGVLQLFVDASARAAGAAG